LQTAFLCALQSAKEVSNTAARRTSHAGHFPCSTKSAQQDVIITVMQSMKQLIYCCVAWSLV